MISFCQNISSYLSLLYYIRKYYLEYTITEIHNIDLLEIITNKITKCGSVMIKFTQWVTPKLELIYFENENEENKPHWLTTLERYYENCENHDLEYTKSEYNRVFEDNVDEIYDFEDIIGSGSIGQVHLVTNKLTQNKEVLKILHPNVKDQIIFFRRFIKFLLWFPSINNKFKNFFPFDIFEFVRQFELQTDFINEANHILYFYEEYKDNDFIIIPQIIKISPSILVMSYEPGDSFSHSSLNDYQKDKIANLYHLFIRNNQSVTNYNHGDLHPGNWKVREDKENKGNKRHKLVIYDFGFCWSIPRKQNTEMGTIFIDTFEESNRENKEVSIDNLCKLMYYVVIYDKPDKETDYKDRIKTYVIDRIDILEPWKLSPSALLKAIIEFCIIEKLLIDPILVQCFIIVIQGQKIFEKYGLMASDNRYIDDYEVFRGRYLDILTFCKTYNIFKGYSQYIETKLNEKQLTINTIFDTINLDKSIGLMAVSKLY